jgi:hypothetical protein
MAAKLLIEQGHDVVLHGRNEQRSPDAPRQRQAPRDAVLGDFSAIAGIMR